MVSFPRVLPICRWSNRFGVPRKCEGFELEITWVEEEHCLYEYDASQGLGMDGFAATKFNDSSHLNNPSVDGDTLDFQES